MTAVDLHFLRLKREWLLGEKKDTSLENKWKEYQTTEKNCSDLSDLTITVTEDEAAVVREWKNKVEVVPNIHMPKIGRIKSYEERRDLLFIGGYNHPPNVDAVIWLCKEIMPFIWKDSPEIKAVLLGSNPPQEVLSLVDDRIIVPGYVKDVSPHFNQAKIFVSPLRFGAGMKGKLEQSMEYGLPVITTDIGSEGMGLEDNVDVLIANDTQTFRKKILNLYNNKDLWSNLSKQSLISVSRFSPKEVRPKLDTSINLLTNELDLLKSYKSNKLLHIGHSHLQCIREYCKTHRQSEYGAEIDFLQLK